MRTFTENQFFCIKQEYEQKFRALKFDEIEIETLSREKVNDDNIKKYALHVVYTPKNNKTEGSYGLELDDFFNKYQPEEMLFSLDFPDCDLFDPDKI